jgi:hypothetical protein
MKPCKICQRPKTYHTWYFIRGTDGGHEFSMDNLLYLEKQLKNKELEEKHKKLNFCQICNLIKKSPFGICKECSERLIVEHLVLI